MDLFPLIACEPCRAERLAFMDLVGDDVGYVCAYCGAPGEVARYVDDSVLSAHGLRIKVTPPVEAPLPKTTGCSKGSCGTGGGCSTGGGCGTCSSGSCGSKKAA